MKLEQQVVSLELAKKLKELGFEQESLFYWHLETNTVVYLGTILGKDSVAFYISAYTVAELGKMLPQGFFTAKGKKWRSWFSDTDNAFEWKDSDQYDPIDMDNEADARAKMLIWLSENNYLETDNGKGGSNGNK